MYRWPLSVSTFTLADKARIAYWLLTSDRYTMGEKVAELEAQMSAYSGMKALMVANGSVANQLVFELWRVKNPGVTPVVICPAVTWISSITPAMMAGMEVVFCDVNLTDLSFDYTHLDKLLDRYSNRRVIIWPTALVGYVPDMGRIHAQARQHGNAEVFLDSCENTFSRMPRHDALFRDINGKPTSEQSILASASITTTSTYFSHMVVSIEGGFVFFRRQEDYDLARMFRNHGMTRSLPSNHSTRRAIEAAHPDVDPQFLFGVAGTNLRPTDVHAMFGLADMKRAEAAKAHRVEMWGYYEEQLDREKYYLPASQAEHVPFCIPIFTRDGGPSLARVKEALKEASIEVRPLVGSHLGRQPALKHLFGDLRDYPTAQWIHEHAAYVGLHGEVTPLSMSRLTHLLNVL